MGQRKDEIAKKVVNIDRHARQNGVIYIKHGMKQTRKAGVFEANTRSAKIKKKKKNLRKAKTAEYGISKNMARQTK